VTCLLSEIAVTGHDAQQWADALPASPSAIDALVLDCEASPLPIGLVAALPLIDGRLRAAGVAFRLTGLNRAAQLVVHLAGRSGLISDARSEDRDLAAGAWPLALLCGERGRLVVEVRRDAGQNPWLTSPEIHDWLDGIVLSTLAIDLGRLEQINSMLVAWLLQLAQRLRPAPIEAFAIAPQVLIQLKQLRVDQMMTLRKA